MWLSKSKNEVRSGREYVDHINTGEAPLTKNSIFLFNIAYSFLNIILEIRNREVGLQIDDSYVRDTRTLESIQWTKLE